MVAENASNSLYRQDPLSLEISSLRNSNGLDAESYRATNSFQSASSLENFSPASSSPVAVSSQLPFTSGIFTVDSTGQVGIDYLFDGGVYQGELAIFSLQGLESLGLGTPEFIKEVGRRALSDSTLGHVVISDQIDGARFSGALPWEDDYNAGDYLGVRTFAMRPGDTFGVMLVADGTVQQVFETPTAEGALHPLFSLVGANPSQNFQLGQIADVDGNGHTFTMEDLRLDKYSDQDYNDIIFQVRGAVGQAGSLDQLIDPNRDWRPSDIGQALLAYAAPYDYPKTTQTVDYNFPVSSQPLIGIIDTGFSANNPDIDYSRLLLGSDRIGNDNNPLLAPGEGNEHGTHILGIIGATQNNGIGIDGINDKAPIWLGRATGSGQWADELAEFVTAHIASNQPNAVGNFSLDLTQKNPDGSVTTRYEFTPAERQAIEFARQHGVLLVVAAGNDGGVMSALGQASQEFDNIITVGAANDQNRATYSSYGNGLDILAPGGTIESGILSTVANGVGTLAGTSVATAQVAGEISQVWAANPKLNYRQVIEIVKLTATDLNTPDWDAETGAGLLNIAAAVNLAKATQPQVHEAPASIIPATWTGEGTTIPFERAVGAFNYPINSESFTGWVGPSIGVNLRYTPWFDDRGSLNEPYQKTLSFDAWTYGERGTDYWLDLPDELWYRVTGTEYWVPSAYIYGYPGSRPSVLAPAQPNPNPDPNPNSNPNPNPTPLPHPIVPIDGNSANYRNGQLNPYAYNPALIGQCTWYAYGRMVETGLLPADAKSRSLFLGNAANWERDARSAGLPVSNTPVQGARGLVVFPPGVRDADPRYGHVAFLEEVYPDGRIRISEANWNRESLTLNPDKYAGVSFVQLENARINSSTSAPPAIPGQQQQYIIKSGDTLSQIAQRYLGNADRWREIKKADGNTFSDAETRSLQIGSSVYLPINYQVPTIPIIPSPTTRPEPIPQPKVTASWPDAAEVIKFIAQQISDNSQSQPVQIMRYLNDNNWWLSLLPGLPNSGIKLLSYALWAGEVASGRPWDQKNDVLNKSQGKFWTIDQVTGKNYEYESWSNQHYGYVGRAAGFTEFELLQGAGLAQTLTNGLLSLLNRINEVVGAFIQDSRNPLRIFDLVDVAQRAYKLIYGSNPNANLFDPSSIDDPRDQASIRDGLRLYDRYTSQISVQDFIADLRTNSNLHNAYGTAPTAS